MSQAYRPTTGARCACRPGVARDNCPACEGTGRMIDFAAIRARKSYEPKLHPTREEIMSTEHTPGPWAATQQDKHGDCRIDANDPAAPKHDYVVAEKVRAENARLIAAAPDLLAALEWLASKHALGNKIGSMSADATRLDPYILEIRAAIARAKGAV